MFYTEINMSLTFYTLNWNNKYIRQTDDYR